MHSSQATSPRKLLDSLQELPSPRQQPVQKHEEASSGPLSPQMSARAPASPQIATVPKLKLPAIKATDDDSGTQALSSSTITPMASSLPLVKSPSARNSERSKEYSNDRPLSPGRTSSLTSPRSESARGSHSVSSARRHRLGSSPQQLISPRARNIDRVSNVPPSPRGANTNLIALGDEAAELIFAACTKAKPQLTPEVVDALGRQDIVVPLQGISTALRMKLNPELGDKQKHLELIKALFLPSLLVTDVGKTLVAMRKMVMMQYDGESLTLAKRLQIEQSDLGFKDRMQANLEQQAKACAAVALGLVGSGQVPSLSASKLPAELISFWKTMDRHLCEWASKNPALGSSQLRKARENLGFDILFTRLLLPVALGPSEESHLVIPMMFYEAVKNALKTDWPAFVDSFIAEQAPRSSDAQSARSVFTAATTTTATTALTNDTPSTPLRTQPGQGTGQST